MTKTSNSIGIIVKGFACFFIGLAIINCQKAERIEHQQQVQMEIVQERIAMDAQKKAALKAEVAKATKGCSKKAKLSNRIIAVGTNNSTGPYFNDTVYTLTFDEAWKAGKSGQAWLLAWC